MFMTFSDSPWILRDVCWEGENVSWTVCGLMCWSFVFRVKNSLLYHSLGLFGLDGCLIDLFTLALGGGVV